MDFLVTVRLTNFDDALDYYSKALSMPRREEAKASLSFETNGQVKILSRDILQPTKREDKYGSRTQHDETVHAGQ
jgi:hypothetical protein